MLQFAGGRSRPALRLLVLHDDPEREFDYVSGAEESLERARSPGLDGRQHQERLGDGLRHLMGEAIGQSLSLAVGIAISPVPIIAVILMLVTPRARVNGPAFVVGWLLGLAVIGTIVLLVAGPSDASENGEPATWVNVLKLVLGAAARAGCAQAMARPPARGRGGGYAQVDGRDRQLHRAEGVRRRSGARRREPEEPPARRRAARLRSRRPASPAASRRSPTPSSRSSPRSAWPRRS